ncbi:MAG TPA: cytochrome b, partial [Mycobacteriales bacterium]|nr:cytochrome b [Mycobacteriales bacterium]
MVMYRPSGKRGSLPARLGYAVDERLPVTTGVRRQLNKVFPDHWSFMLGEIALYSFIILLLTGTYLTFFFDPSMSESRYGGTYTPLRGTA